MTLAEKHKILDNILNFYLQIAREIYGFDAEVQTEIRDCGRTAGWASERNGVSTITINTQMFDPQYELELKNTVSHELAHIVCYWNPRLGRNHDRGWKRVHQALGGDGSRCHSLPLKRARSTKKAIYEVAGKEIKVGLTRHKRIQNKTRSYLYNGHRVTPCSFTGEFITVK